MRTNEMPINPNVLLEMTETRLHCLKATLEEFIGQFGELLGLVCEDLKTTGQTEPGEFFAKVFREPEHCGGCKGRKNRRMHR